MAQELHDVVAHSLSVIAVQAGIGAHLIDRRPAEAARALDAISATCDTTDSELTRLVDILRDGSVNDATSAPTIAAVAALVGQLRAADVPVTLVTDGDLTAVPAGVSLAAYRIVQEALTNVVRHAGTAAVTVTIRVVEDQIDLTVDDDGRGLAPDDAGDSAVRDGGNGLLGMGERAGCTRGTSTRDRGRAAVSGCMPHSIPTPTPSPAAPVDRRPAWHRRSNRGWCVGASPQRRWTWRWPRSSWSSARSRFWGPTQAPPDHTSPRSTRGRLRCASGSRRRSSSGVATRRARMPSPGRSASPSPLATISSAS